MSTVKQLMAVFEEAIQDNKEVENYEVYFVDHTTNIAQDTPTSEVMPFIGICDDSQSFDLYYNVQKTYIDEAREDETRKQVLLYEDKFKKFAEGRLADERAKEQARELEYNELVTQIEALAPRIQKLLSLRQLCDKYKVVYDNYSYNQDKDKNKYFLAEGIYHRVGFFDNRRYRNYCSELAPFTKYNTLAMLGGGFCGVYDIYVVLDQSNNVIIKSLHEKTLAPSTPTIDKLKEFLREFDKFEKNFTNFIDKELSVVDNK